MRPRTPLSELHVRLRLSNDQPCSGMVKRQSKTQMIFDLIQNIQIGELCEIKVGIAFEHLIIEALNVKADNQVQGLKVFNKPGDLVFQKINGAILF